LIEIEDVYTRLPRLQPSPHAITSPPKDRYNCVAWVDRDLEHWWQPEFHWPSDLHCPLDAPDIDCYIELFRRWGFEICVSPAFEPGFLKIAIYSADGFFHHVAKQIPPIEWWSSKIGHAHDVRHEHLDALYESPVYFDNAEVTHYMRRVHDPADPFTLELGQLLLP
jgi:hypothetical protein